MIVYQGVKGVANRGLFLEKFYLYGGGYDRAPAGACLKLYAPDGDSGSIYKFTLRDIGPTPFPWTVEVLGSGYTV